MAYQRPDNWRVIEGVITSLSPAGELNVAPMGPAVSEDGQRFVLRPFADSTTCGNVRATGHAVFHLTEDVLTIARGAIGRCRIEPEMLQVDRKGRAMVLASACRVFELEVQNIDESEARVTIEMRVTHEQTLRPWGGFNRAKHAVIEAAILATRLHLTGQEAVLEQLKPLQVMVDKTGAALERQAMTELREYVQQWQSTR